MSKHSLTKHTLTYTTFIMSSGNNLESSTHSSSSSDSGCCDVITFQPIIKLLKMAEEPSWPTPATTQNQTPNTAIQPPQPQPPPPPLPQQQQFQNHQPFPPTTTPNQFNPNIFPQIPDFNVNNLPYSQPNNTAGGPGPGTVWPNNPGLLDVKPNTDHGMDSSKDSISPTTSTNPGSSQGMMGAAGQMPPNGNHMPLHSHHTQPHIPTTSSSSLISALGQAAAAGFPGLNGGVLGGGLDQMHGVPGMGAAGQLALDNKKRVNSGKCKKLHN